MGILPAFRLVFHDVHILWDIPKWDNSLTEMVHGCSILNSRLIYNPGRRYMCLVAWAYRIKGIWDQGPFQLMDQIKNLITDLVFPTILVLGQYSVSVLN